MLAHIGNVRETYLRVGETYANIMDENQIHAAHIGYLQLSARRFFS